MPSLGYGPLWFVHTPARKIGRLPVTELCRNFGLPGESSRPDKIPEGTIIPPTVLAGRLPFPHTKAAAPSECRNYGNYDDSISSWQGVRHAMSFSINYASTQTYDMRGTTGVGVVFFIVVPVFWLWSVRFSNGLYRLSFKLFTSNQARRTTHRSRTTRHPYPIILIIVTSPFRIATTAASTAYFNGYDNVVSRTRRRRYNTIRSFHTLFYRKTRRNTVRRLPFKKLRAYQRFPPLVSRIFRRNVLRRTIRFKVCVANMFMNFFLGLFHTFLGNVRVLFRIKGLSINDLWLLLFIYRFPLSDSRFFFRFLFLNKCNRNVIFSKIRIVFRYYRLNLLFKFLSSRIFRR